MYLDYFKFSEMPFALTPNVSLFCELKGHEEALNLLLFSLRNGEGFLKIIGEVGSGKTLLCRKLMDMVEHDFITAYIPNPDLNPTELRLALARELMISIESIHDQHELITVIYQKLLTLHLNNKKVVLLIDEAQALPIESLEALRLLTNFETEKTKLLQVVLFGQPELDEHLADIKLRQLNQRITFSYYLPLMVREELDDYLFHRLAMVGQNVVNLFDKKAKTLLYKHSKGVPRIINILCHKALLVAYGKGELNITAKSMSDAINDTPMAKIQNKKNKKMIYFFNIIFMTVLVFIFFLIVKGSFDEFN